MGKGKGEDTCLYCVLILCGLLIAGGFAAWITLPALSWQKRQAMLELPFGQCNLEFGINNPDYTSMMHNSFCMDHVNATWTSENNQTSMIVSLCYPPPGVWVSKEADCRTFQQELPSKQTGQQITTCYVDSEMGRAYVNPMRQSRILGLLISGVLLLAAVIFFLIGFWYVNKE